MYSVEQCAKALKLSIRRVQVFCEQGRVNAKKVSGVWIVLDYSMAKKRPGAGRPKKTK